MSQRDELPHCTDKSTEVDGRPDTTEPGTSSAFPPAFYEQLHRALDEATPISHPSEQLPETAHTTNQSTFGTNLRHWRLQQGYTRATLAAKLDLDPLILLALEQDLVSPTILSVHQLTALYACIQNDQGAA